MCLLFDIKEIIFCTSRPQYTHKIMSVFYFLSSCLTTQLAGLVISAVCRWENAWRACLCTTEFKCGRGIEHSGVRRRFANYGSRNIFSVDYVGPVRPESAVCNADYWGTDGNDQRKWTTFLVHPTNLASAILSKRNKKHRLKTEFIALNLRLHLLWHSCVHRQRSQ